MLSFSPIHRKYKVMEGSTFSRSRSLEEKIPDISKTLQMVEHLKSLKEADESFKTHFELHDTLYAKAEIQPVEEVNLWLGVSVSLGAEQLLPASSRHILT